METEKKSGEPSLQRIVDDVGRAFGTGAIGGSVYHFIKGTYNSPNGARFVGGAQAVRMNAPRLGGTFAVFGGLYSTFDHTMVYMRNKEDPWNSFVAGAASAGFLTIRQGIAAASKSALVVGLFLALIK
uniref:Mitochondrial import inner membrane translocase subunit TIM17-2 n=1 Tax=Noccaea caerulescens TaxID=107243 RepID=A0A1J3K7G1_NOCCA